MTEVRVPDIGEFDEVDVVEVLVTAGQRVEAEEALVTLESDKASMDIPSPGPGVVQSVAVKVGDKVGQGTLVVTLEAAEVQPLDDSAARVDDRVEADAGELPQPQGDIEQAKDTEVLVLGSGPGGYSAAFRAADLGKKVTLVERYPILGGVCLNVGCIPSKTLLHVAEILAEVEELPAKGIELGSVKLDLDRLRAFTAGVVSRLTGGLAQMAKRRGVRVVQGTGRFIAPDRLAVEGEAGGEEISFTSAIIAVGSRTARIPGIPWEDPRVWDSTAALELRQVPKRLLVVGGGIIGLEMATVFDALGSKITVVELLDRLMTGCDADLVRPLLRRAKKRYEAVHLGVRVAEVKAQKRGLRVAFEGDGAPPAATFDAVLVAVGRRPNGDRIDAEAAGVSVDERGFISVDERQRTNVPHIFAIGDVVGEPMLAHKASHQGKVAAEVAAGEASAFDARVIPSVAYTDPEVAWVGLGEEEAARQGRKVETASFPWAASGRAIAMGRSEGKTKLIFDPDTRRLLGGGLVGPRAGDLVAELALAIETGCDAEDIALTIHAHPTLSETVAFASEVFSGTVTDLYLGKKKRAKGKIAGR